MKLTDTNKIFYYSIFSVVAQIPYGKVTSYGHVAYLIGRPENSRMVGSALKHSDMLIRMLQEEENEENPDFTNLPWWRVLSSVGKISPRSNSSSEYRQAELLCEENISVSSNYKVDLNTYGWFPDSIDF